MYDSDNVFAKILRGEIPSSNVYEDEHVLAFHDISKAAPVHVLVIPKGEYSCFDAFVSHGGAEEVSRFFASVAKVAEQLGVKESGYRLICNHGDDAHNTVPHFHMHILGGRELGPLVTGDTELR